MRTSTGPRSLTQMLRDWDDPVLVQLLLDRPDLAFPPPDDFSQVASRATTRHSVAAAADLLDAFELWLAESVAALPTPVSIADIAAGDVDPDAVARGLTRLRRLALLWGDSDAIRPVRVLAPVLGDRPVGPPPTAEQPLITMTQTLTPALVDKVAAGSAFEFVRRMDVLVEHSDHQPLRRRRDGGFTTRQVRILADLLDVPTTAAAMYVELAEAGGMLGLTARGTDEVLIPTDEYDRWQATVLGEQWAHLVGTWIDHPAVGAPGWLTRLCLEGLGEPGTGQVVDADSLRAWVAWRRPRRPQNADRLVGVVLEQATWFGVTALGAPAAFGPTVDAARLDALLPSRVEHVLVQADLTAIAPGPLTVEAARDLGTLADVESRGGATVYRFSAESLRRARDLGWKSEEMLQTLSERSTTRIPQPLSYLVRDVDRHPVTPERPDSVPPVHLPPERARRRLAQLNPTPTDRLDRAAAAAVVSHLRRPAVSPEAAEESSGERRTHASDMSFDGPLAVLREAAETGENVWFGYVDSTGVSGERLVRVTSVDDGVLEAEDVRTRDTLRMPVPRITTAHIIRTGL